MRRQLRLVTRLALYSALSFVGFCVFGHHASLVNADTPSDFSLQVTPSPLVITVKPGQATQIELKIRNAGTATENLKIELRSFVLNNATGQVKLNDTPPIDVAGWVSFSSPTFSVQPGQWFSEQVKLALPKNTGFSYSFALLISRQNEPQPTNGSRLIKGSLAVFTLVNVDRPGATRKLGVAHFTSAKHVYEYLPAELSLQLKNSGNTIVQPYGNIFIQHGSNSKTPLATLNVNEAKGYILPGSVRTLTSSWSDGFPAYQTIANDDGSSHQKLVWNWSKLANFRIGKYTAKLVAVYNDGGHDVPIEGEISFWVIPWKILIGLFIFVLLVLFGLWSLVRKIISLFRRKSRGTKPQQEPFTPKE